MLNEHERNNRRSLTYFLSPIIIILATTITIKCESYSSLNMKHIILVIVVLSSILLLTPVADADAVAVTTVESASNCPNSNSIEREAWRYLSFDQRKCLKQKGYTKVHWNCGWTDEDYLAWEDLPKRRQLAYEARGFTGEEWEERRLSEEPCDNTVEISAVEDFNLVLIHSKIEELSHLSIDALADMYRDVPMRLVVGNAGETGDGYRSEAFLEAQSMGDFISTVKRGDTTGYIHLEEAMREKDALWDGVGHKAISSIRTLVSNHPDMLSKGAWKESYAVLEERDYDWAMFIGAKGTNTAMHYDSDTFNFLYLIEGKKRIVVIPNDNRTQGMFDVETNEEGGTGWTGVNILDPSYTLPEGAVDIIMEPGQGIAIPYLAWHAVENLEASLAVSLRIV